MARAQVLPVSVDEAEDIAAIVRQADIDEICEGLGLDMVHALRCCFGGSCKASKIVVDGKVVAVFGDSVHDVQLAVGVPWLISTVHVASSARAFLKVCRDEVDEMLIRHRTLINFVDARNVKAVRWLRWLGFEFFDPIPYGPKGLDFYPFQKIRMERDHD